MKKVKVLLFTSVITVMAFCAILYSSCTKDKCAGVDCSSNGSCSGGSCNCYAGYTGNNCQNFATTTVDFQNNTYTPVNLTVDGIAYVINAGSDMAFTGLYTYNISYDANTAGTNTADTILGLKLTWSDFVDFPANGTTVVPLNSGSDFFYLSVVNTSGFPLNEIDVNHSSLDPTTDYATIPSDGRTYGIGYYYAYPNNDNPHAAPTDVTLRGAGSSFWTTDPAIPTGDNPAVTVVAN